MSWGAVAGAAVGLGGTIFKGISGAKQISKANAMNPQNPGYTMNQGVIDNARILSDRYGNYQMPGYNQAVNQIGASTANSFDQGIQGASSGGDVLDLASKLAFGQQNSLNQLAMQNAIGKENALGQSINANAQAGQEYVNKNAYDRDIYQGQLREKGALTQAGNQNLYGAIDQAGSVAGSLINPMKSVTNPQGQTDAQMQAMKRYYATQQAQQNMLQNPQVPPYNSGLTGGMFG